jgi:hypothetical protein
MVGAAYVCTVSALADKFSSAGFNNLNMSGYLSQLESVYQSSSEESASLTVATFLSLLKYRSVGRPYPSSYPLDPASYPTTGVVQGPFSA